MSRGTLFSYLALLFVGCNPLLTPLQTILWATSSYAYLQSKQYYRHSRYFTIKDVIPPLQLLQDQSLLFPTQTQYAKIARSLPIVYTNSPNTIAKWFSDNVPAYSTLGFDVESNQPRKANPGPATIQLATPDACLVVHLLCQSGHPSRACLPVLESILMDDRVIKTGVAIDNDLMELRRKWGPIEAKSRLELGGIGVDGFDRETVGLKRLSKAVLSVDLLKDNVIARSNWNRMPLTRQQVTYSARDAWATAAIVNELAARAPETFSSESLRSFLSEQPSIAHLNHLALRRKDARMELSCLRAKNAMYLEEERPQSITRRAARLKKTIRATAPNQPTIYDISPLGIIIEPTKDERQGKLLP